LTRAYIRAAGLTATAESGGPERRVQRHYRPLTVHSWVSLTGASRTKRAAECPACRVHPGSSSLPRRAQRPGRAPRSPVCWSARLDDRLSRPTGGSVISSSPTVHAGPVTPARETPGTPPRRNGACLAGWSGGRRPRRRPPDDLLLLPGIPQSEL